MLTKTKALSCACAILGAAVVLILAAPQRAAADGDDPPGRVARLSFLRGAVSFQPAGESDWVPASINRPMTTGDKLWADMDSRAELHIGSAAIRLNSNTGFSFLNLDDRTVQIQLSAGTLSVRVRRLERDEIFEVDTPNQAFSILRPGEYRLEASEDGTGTIVKVIDGEGEATGGGRSYTIESRERASLTGSDNLRADIDDLQRGDRDDFDDWCEERDHREERSRSARYVSPQVVGYEDLDENGEWHHDPEYGDVWTPSGVPVGWAPYHYGHWAWIAPWGWTWVDDAPWGYAPFHYGRWAYGRGAWFWVPGPVAERPVYAPALVAFVGGPSFGVAIGVGGGAAVAWFPLGPREVFVPAYRVSPAYVTQVNVSNTNVSRTTVTNVYNTTVVNNNTTVVNNVTYANRTAPGAVTAVPTNAFTSAQPVATSAVKVNPNQIANAPVMTRAAVAPTQNSVLGPAARTPVRALPPAAVMNRPVVAKTAPPPPPVSFAKQQSALAAHPGQPLARNEIETIRPANVQQPLVKQAAPSQPGTPNRGAGQVAGAPGAPNRQPGNSPNAPANAAPNRPANSPSVSAPPRNDRPPAAQPSYRPAPAGEPSAQPSNAQPNRPGQPAGVEPSNNRPANVQPSYRPSTPENRPTPAPPANERPSPNSQPHDAPGGQPNRPATPPAPESRTAAPRPEPSGNVHAAPENNNRPSRPAPARSNGDSSDKKKENEKKN